MSSSPSGSLHARSIHVPSMHAERRPLPIVISEVADGDVMCWWCR